ncbi:hypothetical protein ACH95_14135 [Bacillus glycinifermentans]|nr:hypothetical protein ACH95_14135 [Bacillus glycinifermentans]
MIKRLDDIENWYDIGGSVSLMISIGLSGKLDVKMQNWNYTGSISRKCMMNWKKKIRQAKVSKIFYDSTLYY